ncbi:MAG TPA: di-trans,poly-cis-decaprenylcistransferase [Gemmatimonadales bacterium]|nr:di-trans,poly-cis-decaprenylcistransferase [Gemmatimonadales bacterium]
MQYPGLHVAVIMDGNGRWALRRGLPRVAGHRAGAEAVRRTVKAAPGLGVRCLTLYAFSSDNWRRPEREVTALMRLFREYLRREADGCREQGIRINVIGRRDRLPPAVAGAVDAAEAATAPGRRLLLRVAVDYSSRDAILRAARRVTADASLDRAEFGRLIQAVDHAAEPVPPVDLLIRTGGEQRLSDFLLWECAYAELLFLDSMWPDFEAATLAEAIAWFRGRDRRFGGLSRVG